MLFLSKTTFFTLRERSSIRFHIHLWNCSRKYLKKFKEVASNIFKLRYNQHRLTIPLFIAKWCGGNLLPIKIHKSDDYNLIKHEFLFKIFLYLDNEGGDEDIGIFLSVKTLEEIKKFKWKLCGAQKNEI